uniref:Uncharacterized protein n=1 Tax=Plectus sambesii TaxID=2011161 RepID=A0A914VFS6_9BILA
MAIDRRSARIKPADRRPVFTVYRIPTSAQDDSHAYFDEKPTCVYLRRNIAYFDAGTFLSLEIFPPGPHES